MDFALEPETQLPVEIRRRKGTRHLRIRIGYQGQILASVPWHCSESDLERFLESQREWIRRQWSEGLRSQTLSDWLSAEPKLSGSGDVFTVEIEPSTRARADYCFDQGGSIIRLRLPQVEEAMLRQLVRRFAKDALSCRVAYHAKRLALDYSALTVRDQSSRWGSCSTRRGISLNWRLVLLPPALQDYIILHELAHLTEMNHSPRFWARLDRYDPERVAHESALDALGPKIMSVAR